MGERAKGLVAAELGRRAYMRTSMPQLWPIKLLKVFVSFFFELFYVSSLGIFCVALDCTYYRAGPKHNEVGAFQAPAYASAGV